MKFINYTSDIIDERFTFSEKGGHGTGGVGKKAVNDYGGFHTSLDIRSVQ